MGKVLLLAIKKNGKTIPAVKSTTIKDTPPAALAVGSDSVPKNAQAVATTTGRPGFYQFNRGGYKAFLPGPGAVQEFTPSSSQGNSGKYSFWAKK